jgi:uncharacterized protein (DUF169 family)
MKEILTNRTAKALLLERPIMGVRVIPYKDEFENINAEIFPHKSSFCHMVNFAMQGKVIKSMIDQFACSGSAEALGIAPPVEASKSGRIYEASGLYASRIVGRKVIESAKHLNTRNYGVKIAPLPMIDEADMVMIVCNARQAMRIMQGYIYHYGPPENLLTNGIQAVCSDMFSKPFMNNDMNISFLCAGARMRLKASDGELGIAVPVHMFDNVMDGVLKTLNYMELNDMKERILNGLDTPDELGFQIDPKVHYGKACATYRKYADNQSEKGDNYEKKS